MLQYTKLSKCEMGIFIEIDKKENFEIIRVSRILMVRELMMLIGIFYLLRKYSIKRILNCIWLPCGAISYLITRFIHIPYFVTAHGSDILDEENIENKFKHFIRYNLRKLKYLIFKHARVIFANSNFTKEVLVRQGVPGDKIKVVLNGVDESKFKPKGKSFRLLDKHNLFGQNQVSR